MAEHMDEEFMERYRTIQISGLPKYAELREILLAAIEDGYWPPGGRVPNEATLAAATPYSLGTVQKAMRDLVQNGVVIRRRGEGTFVAERRPSMNAPLHLRFEDDTGTPLAVYPHIVKRHAVRGKGSLARFFGTECTELLCIDRVFSVGNIFCVFSSIYMNPARFPLFAERPASELESSNFKDIMLREYNVRVQRIQQYLRTQKLPAAVCDVLKAPKGIWGNRLQLQASGTDGRPVYYQEAFIPPNPCRFLLPDWTPGH